MGRKSGENILSRKRTARTELSEHVWEETALNTHVQISEQKVSGLKQGAKRHHSCSLRTGRGQTDIHIPTIVVATRGIESKKQYLPLYLWLSRLKHGFFFPI